MFAGHLTQRQVNELYQIVVGIVREPGEAALYAALPHEFVASLPRSGAYSDRLYQGLNELNRVRALANGIIPIRSFLESLCIRYESWQESEPLRRLRDAVPTGSSRSAFTKILRTTKRVLLGIAIAAVLLTAGYIYVRIEHPGLLGGNESKRDEGPVRGGTGTGERREPPPRSSACEYPGGWVKLRGDDVQWRLKSIENRSEKLVAVIQVRNPHGQNGRSFYNFRSHPLVMIETKAVDHDNHHAMLRTDDAPRGVEVFGGNEWIIQSGRMLDLVTEFEPRGSATEAKILYAKGNFAQPIELCTPKK